MQLQVAPSLLSADFLHLEKDVQMLNAHADLIHLDVMDGTLVPNLSFGFSIIEPLSKVATTPLDTHLMIVNPDKYFERFAALGLKMLSFHLEAARLEGRDAGEMLREIKALGPQAGLAINPDIPVEDVFPYLEDADFILVMSVFAGFGGQLRKHPALIYGHCRERSREQNNREQDQVEDLILDAADDQVSETSHTHSPDALRR